MTSVPSTVPVWPGKVSAGVILGLTLGFAVSANVWRFASGAVHPGNLQALAQICMWIVGPVWAGTLSLCFFFRSGLSAWGWLLLANVFLFAVYIAGA